MKTRLQPADPCTVVIFGASGDLTRRLLLPSLYNLAEEGLIPDQFAMLGVGRSGTADELREKWREFVADVREGRRPRRPGVQPRDGQVLVRPGRLRRRRRVGPPGRGDQPERRRHRERRTALFYLAIAPEQFLNVCERLASPRPAGGRRGRGWRRVVVEKPFGTDYKSARELNRGLTAVMREQQIYRIDHYLGKETVQNIMVFRFGNGIFEPMWNRRYVDHVQITVAESLGVEHARRLLRSDRRAARHGAEPPVPDPDASRRWSRPARSTRRRCTTSR